MEHQTLANPAVIHGLCTHDIKSAMQCSLRLAPTMINHLISIVRKSMQVHKSDREVAVSNKLRSVHKSCSFPFIIPFYAPSIAIPFYAPSIANHIHIYYGKKLEMWNRVSFCHQNYQSSSVLVASWSLNCKVFQHKKEQSLPMFGVTLCESDPYLKQLTTEKSMFTALVSL